jgi:decaprenylphospho-beta-D-erythro-pentofuranosid-2-ulose 2-reductase
MRNAVGAVQSVLVLGGGSDIAEATTLELVRRGCRRVALAARDPASLTPTVERLRETGADDVFSQRFDARETTRHDEILHESGELLGDIDLALVAFGVLGEPDLFDEDPQAAVEAAETNYIGGLSVCLHLARRMRAQGHGIIVVLSSVAGERVRKSNPVYGSSKAGLDGFALALGDRLAGSGVEVMVVRPGFVHTKMTAALPAAPLSTTPERVAADIMRGLEEGRVIVWSPPALRAVMMVVRHLPRFLFRRLPL